MDQFLCPHFKKQHRRFFPVKLCTVRVKIFLYCKLIYKSPFSNVYILTCVKCPRRLSVIKYMMNRITRDRGYRLANSHRVASSGICLVGVTRRHILERIM